MTVVLDTNVLLPAFVFPGGPPEAVYRRVLSCELTMIVSRPLLAELGRVLVGQVQLGSGLHRGGCWHS